MIVSLRHTDSLVALRYADDENGPAGELLWKLGAGGDFEMMGEGDWFLHAHAPEVLPDGSILLYDNGNERPGTVLSSSEHPPYSRAVRYRLDDQAGTVEQLWEHRVPPGEDPLYAPYVGDADPTPQGTVLIAHGRLLEPAAHDPLVPGAAPWIRILEVEPFAGTAVLDIVIREPNRKPGWRTFGAERLATIHPAGYTIEP